MTTIDWTQPVSEITEQLVQRWLAEHPEVTDEAERLGMSEAYAVEQLVAFAEAGLAATQPGPRPLYEIASEIKRLWRKADGKPNVWFGAVPYLDAMAQLDKITDRYYCDSAKDIVRYFLGNAAQFKGEDAKRIKAELKEMLAS